jgi:TetR/AcrR family transcriptional regulator
VAGPSPAPLALPSPERILHEALELFARKGYDATSVREICAAAGITKPTLYHFYGSKEGVYRALVEGTLERYRSGVRDRLEAHATLADRLKAVVRGHFEYTRQNPSLVRFLLALTHEPPSSAPRADLVRSYGDVVARIGQEVEEAAGQGVIGPGPTDVRVLVFMGAISEALHGYLIAGRPDLSPELADSLVDVVLHGWTPVGPTP